MHRQETGEWRGYGGVRGVDNLVLNITALAAPRYPLQSFDEIKAMLTGEADFQITAAIADSP